MKTGIFLISILFFTTLFSQQVADTTYAPPIANPIYPIGTGTKVLIDEGHHNFHTKEERYSAFAKLLERDGYQVDAYTGTFQMDELEKGQILVISNALNEVNVGDWSLPNPSAFTEAEIDLLRAWVFKGGSLFLIADHMPMAGAATALAAEFGFRFTNGFVFETEADGKIVNKPAHFSIKEESLFESVITRGRDASENVKEVASFTGQAFQILDDATPILIFNETYMNLLPEIAWEFNADTEAYAVDGWSQGAFKTFGKGRIVVFGEAAMFTAQIAGPNNSKMGMNNDAAPENYKLLLNIIHWLDGKLD